MNDKEKQNLKNSGNPISASVPDWKRERLTSWFKWDPSRRLLWSIRCYQYWRKMGFFGRLAARLFIPFFRYYSIVTGADIPLNCQIGGGLLLPHPNGIVIHPGAVVGPNCLLFQQVTLGAGGSIPGLPQLGGHVDVGAGAKILGGVRIGDHAKIGANSVVLVDVPPFCTAVGIPARIIPPKEAPVRP